MVERHAVAGAELGEVGVVRDHAGDLGRQLARPAAEQQVVQAVAVLADQQQQARPARQRMDLQVHREFRAQRRHQRIERGRVGQRHGRLEVDPHEEQAGRVGAQHIAELLRIEDVAAGLVQQTRDCVNNALRVGTGQGENEFAGIGHWDRLRCAPIVRTRRGGARRPPMAAARTCPHPCRHPAANGPNAAGNWRTALSFDAAAQRRAAFAPADRRRQGHRGCSAAGCSKAPTRSPSPSKPPARCSTSAS